MRYGAGEPTRLPYRVLRIVLADRFGVPPATIDRWPAADIADAVTIGRAINEGRRAAQ